MNKTNYLLLTISILLLPLYLFFHFNKPLPDIGLEYVENWEMLIDKTNNHDIHIVQFIDYECNYCKEMHDNLEIVKEKFDVNLQTIHYPFISDDSIKKSKIATCIGNNNIDGLLYSLSIPDIKNELQKMDMDIDLEDCVNNDEIHSLVKEDFELATAYNVNTTPTFIINGYKLQGSISTADFESLLTQIQKIIN